MAKRDGFYKRGRFWWVSTDPITGREKSTGCTDLIAAKGWKANREREKHDPSYARAAKATFGEWAAKLIESKAQELKPISMRAYPQYFGHWVRLLPESTPLSEIGPGTFDDFLVLRRKDGVHDYTIGKEMTGMVSLLRLAKRAGCYPGDLQALRPTNFKPRHVKGTRALTPEEFVRLMSKLAADQQAFVCLCIALGCRRSEAFRVQGVRGETVLIAGTKTAEAHREVPVLSAFRKLLAVAAPSVPLPRSTFWNLGRWLWEACDAAGIPRCCPNDLRRTHATWLKELGVDSDTVRRLLGHTTSALVDGVYGRPRPEKLAELAEKSIQNAPQQHDIPELPAPREPEKHWKTTVTKGAHGASQASRRAENAASGTNGAGISGSRTDENRRNQICVDTDSLHSFESTDPLVNANRARATKLETLAVADPEQAAPGLAACRALEAAYGGDGPGMEAALIEMAGALGMATGGRP